MTFGILDSSTPGGLGNSGSDFLSNFATITIKLSDESSNGSGIPDRLQILDPAYNTDSNGFQPPDAGSRPGDYADPANSFVNRFLSSIAFDPSQARLFTTTNMPIIFSAPGLSLKQVQAVPNPHPADAPPGPFPLGFFSFEVHGLAPGGSTDVTLTLPVAPNTVTDYWRYGPSPLIVDNQGAHPNVWYDFKYDPLVGVGATFGTGFLPTDPMHMTPVETITLHFKDGFLGDDDLSQNGIIVDAGGPVGTPPFAYNFATKALTITGT